MSVLLPLLLLLLSPLLSLGSNINVTSPKGQALYLSSLYQEQSPNKTAAQQKPNGTERASGAVEDIPIVLRTDGYPEENDREPIRMVGVWRGATYYNLWKDTEDRYTGDLKTVLPGRMTSEIDCPQIRFVGENWSTEANARIARREIERGLAEWSSLPRPEGSVTPVRFHILPDNAPAPGAGKTDVQFQWLPKGPGGSLGNNSRTGFNPDGSVESITVWFNSDLSWWFGETQVTPTDRFHFYSTALHEIGHLLGMTESTRKTTVMLFSRGRGANGPSFTTLDEDTIALVRRAYVLKR